MADLTKKQRIVLEAIAKAIDEKGYVPAVREICSSIGLSSPSTVQVHLNSLEERGYIHRDAQKSRSITLTAKGREELGLSEAPAPVTESIDYNVVTLPLVGNVFSVYDLSDDNFALSSDYDLLYTELTGATVLYLDEYGV